MCVVIFVQLVAKGNLPFETGIKGEEEGRSFELCFFNNPFRFEVFTGKLGVATADDERKLPSILIISIPRVFDDPRAVLTVCERVVLAFLKISHVFSFR